MLTVIFAFSLFVHSDKKGKFDVDFLYDQKIPMSDGVKISASIWKPAEMKKPLPAILTMTPYIVDRGQKDGDIFARRGYIIVRADVRGRGNSGGIVSEETAKDARKAIIKVYHNREYPSTPEFPVLR